MFEAVGQSNIHYSYMRASHAVHTTRIGLSGRFRLVQPGHYRSEIESSFEEIVKVGTASAQIASLAALATAEVLSWDTLPSVAAFRAVIFEEVDQLILATGYQPFEPPGERHELGTSSAAEGFAT